MAIQEYVKDELKEADIAHGFDHVQCVVNLAKKIGRAENANLRIVIAAAYLHDLVDRSKVMNFADHSVASADKAEKVLRTIGYTNEEISEVKKAIVSSSYESYERGVEPATLEAKVTRDADWLDAMGARGIARVFVFAGRYDSPEMGIVKFNPENPVKLKMSSHGPDPSPIHHFFSKLLWLRDKMQTKIGKSLANERHEYMVNFLKQYEKEMTVR